MTKIIAIALAASIAGTSAFAGIARYDGGTVATVLDAKSKIVLTDGRVFDLPKSTNVDAGDKVRITFDDDGDGWVLTDIEVRG